MNRAQQSPSTNRDSIATSTGARPNRTSNTSYSLIGGIWITEREYAQIHGLAMQTLAGWRYKDSINGRSSAPEGFPMYKRFGRCVRYWLPDSENGGQAAVNR